MTTILLVVVVLLALLVVCDVTITALMLRRFRGVVDQVTDLRPDSLPELVNGQPVPAFEATAEDGRAVTDDRFAHGRQLIGFFSAGCEPCRKAQPEFLQRLRANVEGLVVVDSGRAGSRELIDAALRIAPVVVEGAERPVSSAFGVRAYPTFVVVEDGAIGAFGIDPAVLDVVGLGNPAAV